MEGINPSVRIPVMSLGSMKPLLTAIAPNPTVLLQYPIFFTMARVTVHKGLSVRPNGTKMSSIHASVLHGSELYRKYGLFALYRGLPVYVGHTFANAMLAHPAKKIRNKKIRSVARVAVDALTYPILLACTRMAAYTTEDSQWGFIDCLKNTVRVDGWLGLWTGALPYLLVSSYKEVEEVAFAKVRSKYPRLDDADTAMLSLVRAGLGAVITSPFLTMSTILRCQSNNPDLLPPTSMSDVFVNMPWKWNLVAVSVVVALGAVNVALIADKHAAEREQEHNVVFVK